MLRQPVKYRWRVFLLQRLCFEIVLLNKEENKQILFIHGFKKILEKNSNFEITGYLYNKESEYDYFLKNLSLNFIIEIVELIDLIVLKRKNFITYYQII